MTSLKTIRKTLRKGRAMPIAVSEKEALVKRVRKKNKTTASFETIEATLLELVTEGTSDAARVSAAKALMELVRYMNGEDNQSTRSDDAERAAAIAEAGRLLSEFAKLKLAQIASATASGVEQSDALAVDGKAGTDRAAKR